jgi:hypothetical protein
MEAWDKQQSAVQTGGKASPEARPHRLTGGLQDWGPCHLTKEDIRVGATARWRKDTREDTPSPRRTIYSDRTHAAVDVKGKFLGTYS